MDLTGLIASTRGLGGAPATEFGEVAREGALNWGFHEFGDMKRFFCAYLQELQFEPKRPNSCSAGGN